MKQTAMKGQAKLAGALFVIGILAMFAHGHCDTMDGPVVKAAKMALKTKNINHVLIWVHEKEEGEVRDVFKKVSRVRVLGREAHALADRYFFETVVRLHRAGEGESYTGLKASGTDDLKLFVEIDKAIERNSISAVIMKLPAHEQQAVEDRFREVIARKRFGVNDIVAGRSFVESYVTFLHLVERIHGNLEG